MISNPNCKINLGLRVLRKRPDGYHDLDSVFLPVPLCDRLEITPLENMPEGALRFTQSGIPVDCAPEDNICAKAYRLLQADFPHIAPASIHLTKNIPFGAGLGGGSSDAAFTLRMLNQLFALGLTTAQLCGYAARLGADCAFFVANQPAHVTGIGDQLSPLGFNPIEDYHLVLAKPNDAVSTREAYGGLHIDPTAASSTSMAQLVRQPIACWRSTVLNDFESTVFPLHPGIAQLKELFYRHGALYASMSGSGATVFALFPKDKELPQPLVDTLGPTLLLSC